MFNIKLVRVSSITIIPNSIHIYIFKSFISKKDLRQKYIIEKYENMVCNIIFFNDCIYETL